MRTLECVLGVPNLVVSNLVACNFTRRALRPFALFLGYLLFLIEFLHSIVRPIVRRWAFILDSTVTDPLKMAILNGLQIRSGPSRPKS